MTTHFNPLGAAPNHDETTRPTDNSRRVAAWFLLGSTLLVAVITFILSFAGLTDYGARVARLGWLSPLAPLAVDGLTLVAIAATFLLRHAHWRLRLYAWLVFGIASVASVAGNLSHANARALSWDGMVGAALWPIFLALASHLAIVTRRALERNEPAATSVATPPANVAVANVAAAVERVSLAKPRPVATRRPAAAKKRPPVRQPVSRDNEVAKQDARRRVKAGESCAQVATDLGVTRKTVERWTEDIRASRHATGDDSTERRSEVTA
jgi:hypothetical protein